MSGGVPYPTYIRLVKKTMLKAVSNNVIDRETDNLRVGRQIRDLRKAKGYTLSFVAERIGKISRLY